MWVEKKIVVQAGSTFDQNKVVLIDHVSQLMIVVREAGQACSWYSTPDPYHTVTGYCNTALSCFHSFWNCIWNAVLWPTWCICFWKNFDDGGDFPSLRVLMDQKPQHHALSYWKADWASCLRFSGLQPCFLVLTGVVKTEHV